MNDIMYVDEINLSIDKINMYIKEENIIFDDINNILTKMIHNYKTNNYNKIDMMSSEIINNLNTILKIHNNNIFVLEKNRDKYVNNDELKSAIEKLEDNTIITK